MDLQDIIFRWIGRVNCFYRIFPPQQSCISIDEKMISEKKIRNAFLILLAASLLVRVILAFILELGNDEVYYWTYAKFPDLSHFDHPPMVGLIIQLFSLNLHFDSEFFLRLGFVIIGTINTWLIFLIGKKIKDSLTGLYAAFLYTASLYCFIISGLFIMPDSPQGLFWLLSLYLLAEALPDRALTNHSRNLMLLAGICTGLALLSKYHSVFLIAGTFFFILFYNRKWFTAKETWIALGMSLVIFLPVLIWNWRNDFISFSFHESRVGVATKGIRWDYILTGAAGQLLYNNPVNGILILLASIAWFRSSKYLSNTYMSYITLMSLPLSVVFFIVSFFKPILPHWTGPAYYGFILMAAAWLSEKKPGAQKNSILPVPVGLAIGLTGVLIILGTFQIKSGLLPLNKWASGDFSAQLYGWRQLGEKFKALRQEDINKKRMPEQAPILTYRWFPAANYDYYVAKPAGTVVYALGTLERIHKYYWIDKKRGPLSRGLAAYYLSPGDDFIDPRNLYKKLFDSIGSPDTIHIFRHAALIRDVYIYRLYGLKKQINFDHLTDFIQPSLDRIRFWQEKIKTTPEWLTVVRKKAVDQNRPLDEMIWMEAEWTAEQERYR